MAVSAAQNAASSCANGVSAGQASAGTLVAGAGGDPGSSTTTTVATTVAVAAVASAVAAGVAVSQTKSPAALPPICPNVTSPEIRRGQLAIDFLVDDPWLTKNQSAELERAFVDTYNDVFGCDSEYARVGLNCSIPCETVDVGNETSEICCGRKNSTVFGDLLS